MPLDSRGKLIGKEKGRGMLDHSDEAAYWSVVRERGGREGREIKAHRGIVKK